MISPGKLNLEVYQGASFDRVLVWKQNGVAKNLTGYTARCQFRTSFDTPVYCASGRFLHIILRIPVGTATASQVIAGMVSVNGYMY